METIRITGNMATTDKYNEDWYQCEIDIANKKGINLDEYKITEVVNGMITRGGKSPAGTMFAAVDAYTLHLEKK